MTLTEYEIQRQKNIAANLAILASLGLEKPCAVVTKQKKKKKKEAPPQRTEQSAPAGSEISSRKRKEEEVVEEEEEEESKENQEGGVRRRSARLARREIKRQRRERGGDGNDNDSFSDDSEYEMSDSGRDRPHPHEGGPRGVYNPGDRPGLPRRIVNGRFVAHLDPAHPRPNPKIFGPIPGIEIGQWWPMRQDASAAGCHAPFVAGIYGTPAEGCYSIALSGGYEDDIDEGFRFTYTGSGGRVLKPKNLRTAPQSCDQKLEGGNAALVKSFETGNPIRVIRGFKGDPNWAPKSGYRYDGLYRVVKWWKEKGLAGYLVYKFAFKRIDGQLPIDLSAGPEEDEEEDGEGEEGDGKEGKEETKVEKQIKLEQKKVKSG